MRISTIGTILLSLIALFAVDKVSGAVYTVKNTCTSCNWATNSTWSGGTVPPNWGNHTVNIDGSVLLTSSTNQLFGFTAINLNGGKSFTSGSSGTPNSLTLQSTTFTIVNGVMTVYGDLTLNSSSNLILTSGSLVVTGNLNLNGGTLTVASGQSVTVGSLTVSSSGGSSLTNNGNLTVNGNVSQSGPITNSSTGSMTVNGNHTMVNAGAAVFNNTGTLNVTGNLTVPGAAKFYVNPDGETFITGNVSASGNQNLIIGTNVNPPKYADMVIRQNLILDGSGDALIDKNGRLAVFGNVSANNNGGTIFTIASGGQVYVDGNMTFGGGGDHIVNQNSSTPYGLYTDGSVTYPGGGSTTGHAAGTQLDMYNEDRPFYNWVAGIPDGPLPIILLYFKVNDVTATGIALKWVTTFEKNFDYFVVERAGSDLKFKGIGKLMGVGGLDLNTPYEFVDELPLTGKNYYRLKSVDLDGSFEYSPVVVGNWSFAKGVQVYPNPIRNNSFSVALKDQLNSPARLELFDLQGKRVLATELQAETTKVVVSPDMHPGIYLLKLSSNGEQEMIKVIIP